MSLYRDTRFGGIAMSVKNYSINDDNESKFSAETEAAIQDAREIMLGKKDAKSYDSASELFEALDTE